MKYRFIQEHQAMLAIERLCTLLQVSRSGDYAWQSRPESNRAQEDRRLTQSIQSCFQRSRATTVIDIFINNYNPKVRRVGEIKWRVSCKNRRCLLKQ